ncbi:MAG: hypothetical protein ACR2GY_02315 [Phycisphaerales bacterium]
MSPLQAFRKHTFGRHLLAIVAASLLIQLVNTWFVVSVLAERFDLPPLAVVMLLLWPLIVMLVTVWLVERKFCD